VHGAASYFFIVSCHWASCKRTGLQRPNQPRPNRRVTSFAPACAKRAQIFTAAPQRQLLLSFGIAILRKIDPCLTVRG